MFSEEKPKITANPLLAGVTADRILFIILTFWIGFTFPVRLYAQSDSVDLNPVVVKGFVPQNFMSGLKIQTIDSTSLALFRFQNIGDALSAYTPVSFKNYGPGQLSTASFRGTSANHTAVLWNGLNINAPTLGQTDFSTIPVAGFDRLSVQYGSSASIVGTDAVGGSILLDSKASAGGFDIGVGRQQESFRNHQTQAYLRYAMPLTERWKFSGKTAIYNGRMNNDYPYEARNDYAVLPTESAQKGVVQDLFLQSRSDQEISAHVWLTSNKLILTPADEAGREMTLTEAYRAMLRYRVRTFTVRTAWVRDIIDYAKGDISHPDHSVTDKLASHIDKDITLNMPGSLRPVSIKTGIEWTHFRSRVPGYAYARVSENRTDIFALTRWQATDRLTVSANFRQALISGYNPPFTPSLGAEYDVMRNDQHRLLMKGSVGRSYRTPTLNERYWKDLGNPDIKPESGWNKELGITHSFKSTAGSTFHASLTAYHNRIRDWTYWNPSRNYRVENLQQVLARGIELQLGYRRQMGTVRSGFDAGYALNKSSQEKAYDNYSQDIIGKQLVFVPLHSANMSAFAQYKATKVTGQFQAVGKRFTTFDNSQSFDGYGLLNILAETTVSWNTFKAHIQGQVRNLTNAFYLNVRNNAMPGRSFALSLTFSYDSQ